MRHQLTRVLPYTPEQLFGLVGDVGSYPQFVPWMTSLRTWNKRDVSPGVTSLDAEAAVGFAFLKEKFATRVTRDANTRHIKIELLYGPFKHLVSNWRFEPCAGGTKLLFDIDFAFKSRLLETLLTANFSLAVNRLIECFEARAKALYGVAQVIPDGP
ncbi:MAG: type II toxin-antitoxin system RatA family toxin [Parcubacteria group bacterium]